jgi:hypothetical protein
MRSHGVPKFPDPTFAPGGYGVIVTLREQAERDPPALERASKVCADEERRSRQAADRTTPAGQRRWRLTWRRGALVSVCGQRSALPARGGE